MSDGSNIDAALSAYDTPTKRATVASITVDELDAMLEVIRARRLIVVQKLEALAKVKADEARLELFMKYERAVTKARRTIEKADEALTKAEGDIHKVRLLVLAIEMEVA